MNKKLIYNFDMNKKIFYCGGLLAAAIPNQGINAASAGNKQQAIRLAWSTSGISMVTTLRLLLSIVDSMSLLYWEFPGKQRAARKGDWKCVTIKKKNAPLELYNLKNDPIESHNLAKEYPEMVEQFDKEMKAARKPSPNWPLPDDPK